jgi:hypothetical protein
MSSCRMSNCCGSKFECSLNARRFGRAGDTDVLTLILIRTAQPPFLRNASCLNSAFYNLSNM